MINVIQFRTLPTDDLHSSEWAHLLGLEVQDLETACKNFEGYPNTFAQGDALMLLSRIENLAAVIKTKISQPINCGRCEDDPANWPCIICDR